MKKLLLLTFLFSAMAAFAQTDYVAYTKVTSTKQFKTVSENDYQAGVSKPQGYMLCASLEGSSEVYSLSIEEYDHIITYHNKPTYHHVSKAIASDVRSGSIYLPDKEDHGHREFFIGKVAGTEDRYYLWTLDESDGKVKYLCTDANYSLFLATKADADAKNYEYKMNPSVTGTTTAGGGGGNDVIRRANSTTSAAITLGNQTVSCYIGGDEQFFYAYNGQTGKASNNANAVLYISETGVTTGVENVAAENNAPVEYYTLLGTRVENPAHGVYIMRQGNVTKKVLVK